MSYPDGIVKTNVHFFIVKYAIDILDYTVRKLQVLHKK